MERPIANFQAKWSPGVLAFFCRKGIDGHKGVRNDRRAKAAGCGCSLPVEGALPHGTSECFRHGRHARKEIVEIPIREVRRIWMNALFRLRQLLREVFFLGRTK